jgi:hypothetical protein
MSFSVISLNLAKALEFLSESMKACPLSVDVVRIGSIGTEPKYRQFVLSARSLPPSLVKMYVQSYYEHNLEVDKLKSFKLVSQNNM